MALKSGFAAVIGRPSAGKSTLLNALCGWKVSIVSPVPQTTRNRIRGIVNRPRGQIVFVDTPGYHISDKKLNLGLKRQAEGALSDADAVLYVVDSVREPGKEEEAVWELLRGAAQGKLVIAINKTDAPKAKPAEYEAALAREFPGAPLLRISALKESGLDGLLERVFDLMPDGPAFYPEEYGTDQEPSFRICEIIREKACLHTREELPHSVYVDIADAKMSGDGKTLAVRAFLVTERESQKGMLIGKGAAMIKRIRQEAERDLADIFPYRVSLDLQVKVDKNWRQDDRVLRRLGLSDRDGD